MGDQMSDLMTVVYPIFGQDRDKWMYMIDAESRLAYHLETIDIENGEYSGWDMQGKPIQFYLENERIKVQCQSNIQEPEKLKKAILHYAR
jgi:hypothetical protein